MLPHTRHAVLRYRAAMAMALPIIRPAAQEKIP